MCAPAVFLLGPGCWEPLQGRVLLRAEPGQIAGAGGTAGTVSSPATTVLGRCLCTSLAGLELPLG